MITKFKEHMMCEFDISDLGLLTYYLGIEVSQENRCITIKQIGYAKKVVEQFGMTGCN
jgi:hypothetical protein